MMLLNYNFAERFLFISINQWADPKITKNILFSVYVILKCEKKEWCGINHRQTAQ